MCYGSGCYYEARWSGECRKPSRLPCPMDEEAMRRYVIGPKEAKAAREYADCCFKETCPDGYDIECCPFKGQECRAVTPEDWENVFVERECATGFDFEDGPYWEE